MLSITISKVFCDKYSKYPMRGHWSIAKVKHYLLKATVFFDFNKYILNQSAKARVKLFVSELSTLNLKEVWIIMLGYTDRIGTYEYNYKLAK
ncbi:OmpA family protein [Candidatus Ishikawella capsulata]|uniref:OmpA family protein n=1 Tax=Candidatus Ishikawella capsulata TaxID=168169 RepID=UPI000596C2AD|nr:OmpA family protein [Candidatus Ishikawaella capsulata]